MASTVFPRESARRPGPALGVATAGDGRPVGDDDVWWELDGESVGTGADFWAEAGDWEGDHRATMYARADGLTASTTVRFEVTGSGRPAYRSSSR